MPLFLRVRELTDAEAATLAMLTSGEDYPYRSWATDDNVAAVVALTGGEDPPDSRWATNEETRRARIVLLSAAEQSVKQIARELGVSSATVRTWIKRFNDDGVRSLRDRKHTGRPQTLTPAEREQVVTIAHTVPRELGLPFDGWTLDLLHDYCTRTAHLPVTRDVIFRVLHKVGWVGRTRRRPYRQRRHLLQS